VVILKSVLYGFYCSNYAVLKYNCVFYLTKEFITFMSSMFTVFYLFCFKWFWNYISISFW